MSDSDNRIIKIAFSGGPTSGKSSVIQHLKNHLNRESYNIYTVFVDEIAGMFFRDIDRKLINSESIVLRQTRIFRMQTYIEDLAANMCADMGKNAVVITDRGVCDLECYLKENEIEGNFTSDELKLLDGRYDEVFYLEPAGLIEAAERIGSNAERQENSADNVIEICEKTRAAWIKHYQKMHVIPQYPKIEEKADVIAGMINEICGENVFDILSPSVAE